MRERMLLSCTGLALLVSGFALGVFGQRSFRWGEEPPPGVIADQQAKQQAEQEEIKDAVIDNVLGWNDANKPISRDKADFVFETVDRRKDGTTVVLGWAKTINLEGPHVLCRFWLEVKRDNSGKGWKVQVKGGRFYPPPFDEPPAWKK